MKRFRSIRTFYDAVNVGRHEGKEENGEMTRS